MNFNRLFSGKPLVLSHEPRLAVAVIVQLNIWQIVSDSRDGSELSLRKSRYTQNRHEPCFFGAKYNFL